MQSIGNRLRLAHLISQKLSRITTFIYHRTNYGRRTRKVILEEEPKQFIDKLQKRAREQLKAKKEKKNREMITISASDGI